MLASVLGRRFELGALAALTGREPGELSTAIEASLEAGLLLEVPGPAGSFEFSHALVRETLYRTPSSVRRELLHSRAGDALAELACSSTASRPATSAAARCRHVRARRSPTSSAAARVA